MGGQFQLQLRSSLVNLLAGSLRGGSGRPAVARILKSVRDAVCQDALAPALRNLDRAWRCFPGEAPLIAPLYARALMLDAGDYDAALSIAQLAIESAPDPDMAAIRVLALLHLERCGEAVEHLERALADYCVFADGALACAADQVVKHPSVDAPGWIGLSPALALVSRLADPDDTSGLLVRTVDGQRLAHRRGVRLLGSGARAPADFLLDGRAVNQGRRVFAWARLGCLPGEAPRLRFADEDRGRVEVQPVGPPEPGWRWACVVKLDGTSLRGDCIHVSALLPDGTWHALPDAPLLLKPRLPKLTPARAAPGEPGVAGRVAGRVSKRAARAARRQIDIIIPVYGNRAESLVCIESARRTTAGVARIVVVDDASPDPELTAALDALASSGAVTLLRNAENLGFAGAVNRGLAYDESRDAVLLNSDTVVFDDWLTRMQAAAYCAPAVGTVTPLSNNGSIASYPRTSGNAALAPEAASALHALAASTHPGRRVEIPVGVGFCLYLRRDCLNAVGGFDADVFGKGYGEETDFCMRARRVGWTHRLAADVYVSHAGGASFGTRRAALLDRSQRLLNLRHPGYDRSIVHFLARDPVHAVRRGLDEQRLRAHAGRHVLIVTLALAGGVDRFVKQRCLELRALGYTPILLRPAKPEDSGRCELIVDGLDLPNLQYAIPKELPALEDVLGAISFESIEIQHFLHLDARVIEAVRALPARYDVFVHDYAWMCPRVTLMDGRGRYCGEPAVAVCEACVKRHGSNLGEALTVKALRARSSTWLRAARRVIAPSHDTAARFERHFTRLGVDVRPHAAPTLRAPPQPRLQRAGRPLRIALIGAIGAHKGYGVLLDCARDARVRRLAIEFVVIGYTQNDAPLLATGKVFITGPYIDGEAPHLIARERPDAAWLPSVWPETWCYTLDYALGAGLPVVAFDLGAIAERLRDAPDARLLPLGMKAAHINDRLLDFVNGTPVAARAVMNSVTSLRAPARRIASIEEFRSRGKAKMKSPNGKASLEGHEPGLSASVQVLPLAAGLYLFSVKAAKPQASSASGGQLALPAMHVGLGPGVHSDQVEFLSSPSTHGAWLFSATDQLVTRVNGNGATLILTSVRAPTGDVLSIKVERLDARIDTAATAAATAAPPFKIAAVSKPAHAPLSVQITAHIRARGDMQFIDAPWAGRVSPGLWIESFAVLPLERLGAHDIEYKGLTGSGFETPWLGDNAACGTKGMGVPLVGFAVRLRPSAATAGCDCEYSGYFQSGLTVGPLRNGAPCRSSVANDPLEGIRVTLVKRASAEVGQRGAAPAQNGKGRKSVAPGAKAPAPAAVKPGKRVALAR